MSYQGTVGKAITGLQIQLSGVFLGDIFESRELALVQ